MFGCNSFQKINKNKTEIIPFYFLNIITSKKLFKKKKTTNRPRQKVKMYLIKYINLKGNKILRKFSEEGIFIDNIL